MTIYEQENILWEDLSKTLPEDIRNKVCIDGLCPCRAKDFITSDKDYLESRLRVVFVSKDMNNNPGEDIRDWPMYDIPEKNYYIDGFYLYMLKILWALNVVTYEYLPSFNATREAFIERAKRYPLVNINLKKESGGPSVTMREVNKCVIRDEPFLRQQIKALYQPTVIVCLGGDGYGRIKDIITERIYNESQFVKYNDWCYYSYEDDLLVIDGYHPKARVSNEDKYNELILNVQDFLHQIKRESLSE